MRIKIDGLGVTVSLWMLFQLTIQPAKSAVTIANPILSGPYTLSFEAKFNRVPNELVNLGNGTDFHSPGLVTVSSDGKNLLWKMQFKSWIMLVDYDSQRDLNYFVSSSAPNAQIQKGSGTAFALMRYLPCPGVGFYPFPLLRDVSCDNGVADCKGALAFLGSVQQDNAPAYDSNCPVTITQWGGDVSVVSSCMAYYRSSDPGLGVRQQWSFSSYERFKSVPIARQIEFQENIPVQHGQSRTLVPDCDVIYKLKQASPNALPAKDFELDSYLSSKNMINDQATNTPVTYGFDPKGGSFDDMRTLALRRQAALNANRESGKGPDRTHTGVYALLALLFGTGGWFLWRRNNVKAQ